VRIRRRRRRPSQVWAETRRRRAEGEAPSSPVYVPGPLRDPIGPLVDPARPPFGRRIRQIADHVDMGRIGRRAQFLLGEFQIERAAVIDEELNAKLAKDGF